MKPTALRIERLLAKVEAEFVPPPRRWLQVIIHEGDDEAEAMEKALAEHIAAHPEDAGRTVKDFKWAVWEIVHRHQFVENADFSEGKDADEDEDTDSPSETPIPIPPDPDCPARSAPWRPVHQRRSWITA